MSYSGLQYTLAENFLTDSLKVRYDFSRTGLSTVQQGSTYYSYLPNLASSATGECKGIVIKGTGSSVPNALLTTTGSNGFLSIDSGNFTKSAVLISGDRHFAANACSAVFSFAGTGACKDGVLFGSLKKRTDTVGGSDYQSAEGFNFGITSRGHLFFHTFSDKGDCINVATDIELAPKNIVSFAIGGGEVEISRFDYLNEEIQSQSFPVKTSLVLDSDSIYLGGSPTYYRTASGVQSLSGFVDDFLLFSGKKTSEILYAVGEGLIGDYVFNSGTVSGYEFTTGYLDVPVYRYWSGITGYSNVITGYDLIPSGNPVYTTTTGSSGSFVTNEGDRYQILGSGSGFFIEEQGYLNPALFGIHEPTGDSAHATLGLQSGYINAPIYEITEGYVQQYIQVPKYYTSGVSGLLSGISGYSRTPLTETRYITGAPSSGLAFGENASSYKKDYLYFLGPR